MNKFERNGCLIYHGDSLEILKSEIKDGSIDLIFADPPYNIGKKFANFKDKWPDDKSYAQWCFQWLELCLSKIKPNGSMYVMTSTQAMPYLDLFLRDKITILSRITWCYDSSGVQAKKFYGSLYEPILFCVKNSLNYTFNTADILIDAKTGSERRLIDYRKPIPTLYNTKKVPGNVWFFPRVRYLMNEYEEHPSQKPEALLERIILASSNPGDTILDPFAGTFTTCAVAKRLNRSSIGIEREEEYLKIGLRRLGILCEYKGESLNSPRKNHKKKNYKGRKKEENNLSLFT